MLGDQLVHGGIHGGWLEFLDTHGDDFQQGDATLEIQKDAAQPDGRSTPLHPTALLLGGSRFL